MLVFALTASVQAETLRDPTRPGKGGGVASVATADKERGLQLNSIVSAGANSHVLINNQIYVVGDTVQGVKITRIGINSVSLADGRKLRMYQIITETKGSNSHDSD
ncbi:MSHA biogenesis protein MshK [Shewanella hanedai]|jgi:MSHA biogenesis protein MshK|uniref:MSHA biogenesis protein MshK n=2 Tax=Shewanella hanedai TaxID=25 RepID=A0A553JUC9_SHEHA|nr:MSHA biogenesis protein MshK [Shewanella hanedai]